MTQVQNEPATRPLAPRALAAAARRLTAARLAALDGAVLREGPSRPGAPGAGGAPGYHLYCGWCHATIEDVGGRHVTRCDGCGRNVAVPSYITVLCERCGHSARIAPRKLATERLCTVCGKTLKIGDLVLAPYRHHHQHHHQHHVAAKSYGDAAWAMLIIGLTLVILVLSLTVL
jgi:hypothetical protein